MVKKVWKNFKKGLCCTLAVIVCAGTMSTLTVNAAPTNTFEDVYNYLLATENETKLPIPLPEGVKAMVYQLSNGKTGALVLNEVGKPLVLTHGDKQSFYEYDNLGRLVGYRKEDTYSPIKMEFRYNANNQVVSIADTFVSRSVPKTNNYSLKYDEHGNIRERILKETGWKDCWNYIYDEHGRITEIVADVGLNNTNLKYTYNADGSYVEINEHEDIDYYYDATGKLVREETKFGAMWRDNYTYMYNEQGLLISLQNIHLKEIGSMGSGEYVTSEEWSNVDVITYNYTYDELGRITSLVVYDPNPDGYKDVIEFNPQYDYYFFEY